VSQRGVQLVIRRLLTDADFRHRFEAHASECLVMLRERGVDLNETELAALVETDRRLWSRMAGRIDRRLQRVKMMKSATSEHSNQPLRSDLTSGQQRVLSGVCEGLGNKEIAATEGVSEGAVKATVQQLFHKMRVRRRAQLVRLALEGTFGARRHAP
jgi:DNA-binding NarL/FixJ family response regulator